MPRSAENIQPGSLTGNPSFLFKSSPGGGKTLAACSAAIFGRVYLAYFDKAEPIELAWLREYRPELLKLIDWDPYSSVNAHEYINFLRRLADKGNPYAAVITDSVTFMTSAAVNWSLSFRPEAKDARGTIALPDFDDYKTEASYVSQALDICKGLNCINIWTAHPMPRTKIEANGSKIGKVTTHETLVSYGTKVGAMIAGGFQEIYHFGRQGNDRIVYTDAVGDDYAKTSIKLPKSFNITNRLFFEVWKEYTDKAKEEADKGNFNPFKDHVTEASASRWE